jgi:cytochrome c5
MKNVVVSISALFLAAGLLSGCGEKKEEAPKAEAPAAAAAPAEQAAAPAVVVVAPAPAASSNPMTAMTDAANSAATAMGDAAKSAGDAATKAADSATQAAGDAAKAAGDAAKAAGDATTKAADATAQAATDATAKVADATAPAGAVDGEKVYKGLCFSCHDMGVAGAPKMGDKADWGPRIAKGADALHKSAIEGRMNITPGKIMPAKGGNPALSDDEVKAAVDYMISKNK